MNVSGVSFSDSLLNTAVSLKTMSSQSGITVAVMKQIQEQQKIEAEGLLKMINSTPTPGDVGSIVDVSA
jgi:DnaJ-class molecular chaperone